LKLCCDVVVVVDDDYGILSNKCINIHESILWNAPPNFQMFLTSKQKVKTSHLGERHFQFGQWISRHLNCLNFAESYLRAQGMKLHLGFFSMNI